MALKLINRANILFKRNIPMLKNCLENNSKLFSTEAPKLKTKEIEITFVKPDGERIKVKGKLGDTLLDVVVNSNLNIDGFGACDGTLTCSTCHLIFNQKDYDDFIGKPSTDETDMLDLIADLKDTSRLGCQITLTEKFNEIEIMIPDIINDARS